MRYNVIIILVVESVLLSCSPITADEELADMSLPILSPQTRKVNNVIGGYYEVLPGDYHHASQRYPLLICIHGSIQYGNGGSDLSRVLIEGIPEVINEKRFPASFDVDGQKISFVVLIPQLIKDPGPAEIVEFVQYAIANYRIDTARIYLSGFSSGAMIITEVAGEYPEMFAAAVSMAGAYSGADLKEKGKAIAEARLPMWFLHNDQDLLVSVAKSKDFVSTINSFDPEVPARLTIFPPWGLDNHDAWTKASDPGYREDGVNIYEWMLRYRRKSD
jgi:predicted peptidase